MVLFRFAGWLRHPISIITIVLSVIVVWNVEVYFQDEVIAPFLREKQAVANHTWWLTAFYFHIVSASVCLLVGLPLMFKGMLRFKRTHHFLGYLYFNSVLWVAAPTGLLISPVAKGGWISAAGFLVTGLLWWWFTWKGYTTIRRRQVKAHIRWVIRSYAVALSAVFFRLFQIALFWMFQLDAMTSYVAAVWLSLLASLLLSETAIYFASSKIESISTNANDKSVPTPSLPARPTLQQQFTQSPNGFISTRN